MLLPLLLNLEVDEARYSYGVQAAGLLLSRGVPAGERTYQYDADRRMS